MRLMLNVSFLEPLQLVTSGYEEDSLYAIWKYIHGKDVYTITTDIPFTFSNFNWLYYDFYGVISGLVMGGVGLADPWLPTVTRMITLIGAIIGAWVSYRIMAALRDVKTEHEHTIDIVAIGLILLVFFGPLPGFWTITTRPDIWTTALDAVLILGFLRLYTHSAINAALWALVLGYITWSFKSVDVTAAASVGVFFLWRREWGAAFILAVGTLSLWMVTYLLGSEAYQFSMLGAHQGIVFTFEQGIRNLVNLAVKAFPILLPVLAIIIYTLTQKAFRERIKADWRIQFLIIASVCTYAISIFGSFKFGGAENYFFTPMLILSFLVYWVWRQLLSNGMFSKSVIRSFSFALVLGWALTGAASASVIAGINGVTSNRHMHSMVTQMQPCLQALPKPVFVKDLTLSLPWITPADESFILSFYYYSDRAAGRVFEAGGIGGMIKDGFFNALVFEIPLPGFDGASFDGYEIREERCGDWIVYLKAQK